MAKAHRQPASVEVLTAELIEEIGFSPHEEVFESQRDHEREKAKPPKGLFLFEDEKKAVQFALVFGRVKKKEERAARRLCFLFDHRLRRGRLRDKLGIARFPMDFFVAEGCHQTRRCLLLAGNPSGITRKKVAKRLAWWALLSL